MNNEDQFKTPEERLNKFNTLNEDTDNKKNRTANDHRESGEGSLPTLSTQGDADELDENLGGSTNLSLDQLKEDED